MILATETFTIKSGEVVTVTLTDLGEDKGNRYFVKVHTAAGWGGSGYNRTEKAARKSFAECVKWQKKG